MISDKNRAKFNDGQLLRMKELFEDFKCLLPRFIEVRDDEERLAIFCNRNRSQVFDLQFLKTGLISNAAKVKKVKRTDEHYFNRVLSCNLIFSEMALNLDMSFDVFIDILIKYASTIKLTKKEHNILTKKTKGMNKKTLQDFKDCGIIIEGLEEYVKSVEN